MRPTALIAALAAAAALAACSGGEGSGAAETAAAGAGTSEAGTDVTEATANIESAPEADAPTVDHGAEAEAFLAENGAREGVITTASGLQYEIVESGPADGPHPAPGQYVCVHYRGALLDGTEFDSSYARNDPAAFPSDRLIEGWVEALALMRPGDKWKLYVHPDLAYGARGVPGIPANSALVFDIELLKLLDGPTTRPNCEGTPGEILAEAEAFLAENGARDGVVTTDSGLQYEIVESGPADGAHPAPGQFVCAHYRGVFLDGSEFDSSYARGVPAAFQSDRLITGWIEALALMRPGDKWKLYIHPDLAYGSVGRPSIPPNSALVFDIELLKLLDGPVAPGVDCSAD